jgi:signal transduction histidine kinase/DNA-binding response OmpR family regulator
MKHFGMKIENKSLSIFPPNFFIFEDNANRLWVHPRGGGFAYYDAVLDNLIPFYNEPFSATWQFSNMMHTAFSDRQGNLWLSTRSHGLEKAVFMNDIFKATVVDPRVHSSINNDIKAILEDRTKKLWVSSKGGKIYVYRQGKQLGHLSVDGSISNGKPIEGFCYCMMEDQEGNLWIGTKGDGIYKLMPDGMLKYKIVHYKNSPGAPYSLNNNNIYSIFQDKKKRIWVGTYGGGLNLMDSKEDGRFYHAGNLMKQYPSRSGSLVRIISSDKFGNICIGTTQGLIVFAPDFKDPSLIKFNTYANLFPKNSGMNGNDIHDICTTRNGDTYIAIFGGGISRITGTDKNGFPIEFENFNKSNGLPSDISLSMQEDLDGKLWIITEGNLTSLNPKNKSFETYSEVSRLIEGYNFSEGARFSSPDGTIYFGFSNGFLSVRTDQITENTFIPYIALTQLRIDNKIVPIGQDSPLKQAIDDMKTLELNHKQNSFTIEFAALDYVNPNNISYAYKLDGVDKDWIVNSRQHQVTYAKLGAGKYVFHLKSTNSDGIWVNNERTLTVIVHPPFWASSVAYVLYFVMFVGILYIVLKTIFTFYRLQDKIELEHEQTEMRTRFFTDISHEIRTPLTMIVSPVESIVEDKDTPPRIREQLQLVAKNANRMLRMVNQILDFRKIQKQVLNVQETQIGKFVLNVCSNFQETTIEKDISLHVSNNVGDEMLWIDRDGVEKLLFNLLANAIKYTPAGKSIYVDVFHKDNHIVLSVVDEGRGMTKEIQNKIFTRFASFNKDKNKPSTGIGLSIVKEVADKHKAKIEINSEINNGSSFMVSFNKGIQHFDSDTSFGTSSDENLQENFLSLVEESDGQALEEKKQEMQQSILVVEDDADLRGFIKSSLGESYHVYEAENGKDGYSIASQTYPDFIISDVMMPEINGFELLQMIRKNRETSHVPFILLTAKTDIESMLEGLEYGADDYISKPFSVKYLKARIANIMSLRHNLLKFYQAGAMSPLKAADKVDEKNGERLITPHDEEFITKARAFIIQNIDNSNFVVEDLATEMSMSRTVFFKKLKGLTGLAPIEFIREIKIRHAADMIVKENYSIKEIAFQIGFADTKYFTQCFKQIFGCTPSEYRKGNEEKA